MLLPLLFLVVIFQRRNLRNRLGFASLFEKKSLGIIPNLKKEMKENKKMEAQQSLGMLWLIFVFYCNFQLRNQLIMPAAKGFDPKPRWIRQY